MPSRHDSNNPNCRFTYDWSADSATDFCTCGVSMGRSAQDDQKWDQPRFAIDHGHTDLPVKVRDGGTPEKDREHQHHHYLVITNNEEDTGQDGYYEDLEWEIEHDPDCPYSIWYWSGMPDEVPEYKEYNCHVGQEVTHNGINGLEFITGTGDGWRELEEGRYEIEAWAEHQPSTPMGPEEWDGGLRFVDG